METRTCRVCGRPQPPTEFYRTNVARCKTCVRAQQTAYRWANIERVRARDRERGTRPERQARMVGWDKKYLENAPEKVSAHRMVKQALRTGSLVRQPCEVCSNPKSDAHHDDYTKPLTVRWLCRVHHAAVHQLS